MTSKDQALVQPDPTDDDLVAYLDDELDPERAELVEHRLATDAGYRQQLRQLERAWELLDDLPRPECDEKLTRTTMQMVATSAAEETVEQKRSLQIHHLSMAALVVATGLVSCLLGYNLIHGLYDIPNQRLLRDLPIIEKLDVYQTADSVEFLHRLADEGLFDEEIESDVP